MNILKLGVKLITVERATKVVVFETDNPTEMQLIRSKLDDAGISSLTENGYMTFTTTPTATALKLKVGLEEEQKAFEIIDSYLQSKES